VTPLAEGVADVLAGQKLGVNEVDEEFRLVSFMHYDLGYFDLEQKTFQTRPVKRA
jgi:hypothetical protein